MLKSTTAPSTVEVLGPRQVRVHCRKCGEALVLDFGECQCRQQAQELVGKLDKIPRECPGYHVELSGWKWFWQLDEAVDTLFPV